MKTAAEKRWDKRHRGKRRAPAARAQCVHHRAVSRIITDLKHVFTAARVRQAYGKPIEAAAVLVEGCLKAAKAAEKVKP